jgi:hypothetical protein
MSGSQRVSRGFHRLGLFLSAVSMALVAGTPSLADTRKQDHSACKLKALELYKSKIASTEWEEEQAYYVKVCMEAHGYKERSAECGGAAARWNLDDCFQPE